jgi:hypothetical protein
MMQSSLVSRALALVPAIQRLSPRERLLIGSLGAIALVLIPLKAYDWQQSGSTEAQEAQLDLESARQAAQNGVALAINRQLAIQRKQVRNWAWTAPSLPIGRVLLENQVATLALQAGLKGLDVKSADTVENVGGLNFVELDVSAVFDWITLAKFLDGVGAMNKGVIISSISEPDDAPPKVQVVLRLPLVLTPGAER